MWRQKLAPIEHILPDIVDMMGGEVVEIFLPGEALVVSPYRKQLAVRDADQENVPVAVAEVIRVVRADFETAGGHGQERAGRQEQNQPACFHQIDTRSDEHSFVRDELIFIRTFEDNCRKQ